MRIREIMRILLSPKRTVRQKRNLFLGVIQFAGKRVHAPHYPATLTIDPCNACNLQCLLCPAGRKDSGRPQALMSFPTFKRILDECGRYLCSINLFNWGEPLLNKDVPAMVRYATQMNIDVNISTNLNHLDDAICRELIESRLTNLVISLDGASQESVSIYQKGSDFQAVLSNIERFVQKKKTLGSNLPHLRWRFLVNRHNENEIDKARGMSARLGIDRFELGFFRCDMSKELLLDHEAQYESVEPWLPRDESLSMYNYAQRRKKVTKRICRLLWFESVIHPDGSVSPCCACWPKRYDFGNIHESSFRAIWNGPHYRDARRISRGDDVSARDNICGICKKNNAEI